MTNKLQIKTYKYMCQNMIRKEKEKREKYFNLIDSSYLPYVFLNFNLSFV